MTNLGKPLVSLIVLSFNRCEETIGCLQSLAVQTYPNLELVVLDNGSRDNSVEAISSQFPEAHLLKMPINYGDWEGRNIALQSCSGELVMLVDSDAVIPPDAVEKLSEIILADSSLAAVQPALQDTKSKRMYNAGFGREKASTPFYKAVFHGCSVIFRRKLLVEAGGFPHLLLGGAEDFLSYRFFEAGYRNYYYPAVVVRHSMSPKERVLKMRLMYQSMQKLRAKVAHVHGTRRLIYEITKGLLSYTYHNLRGGHFLFTPVGIWNHGTAIWNGLRERKPIQKETMQLFDQLQNVMVTSNSQFDSIDHRPNKNVCNSEK